MPHSLLTPYQTEGGFMFITFTKKSPFYQLVYEVNGKRTHISTCTKNKKKAEKFMEDFRINLLLPQPKQFDSINLSAFCTEYVDFMRSSKSQHYIRDIELSFKQLKKFTGNINLDKIDLKTIDQFINEVYSRSTAGALLYYRTLKAAFSKAVVWEYIPDNPFKKIKPPRQIKNYPTFINDQEFELILSNTPYNFCKDMFTVAYQTGMRLSELCNMKWSWIDLENKIIIPQNGNGYTTKSKKSRIIPMSSKVYTIIKNRFDLRTEASDDFVFYHYKGMRFKEDYITHQFKKAVRRAMLNDSIHFHTLRHSFASNLVQKGVSLYVVKELLGHSDLSTTQIYSHLRKQNLFQAVSLL